MNSWKFRFIGLVVTTLFITSLIASPMEIYKKSASDVISKSDLRTEKVGEVISASERSSALGINGGSLKSKEGEVIKAATKEGVVLKRTNSALRLNDRAGHVIQNDGRPDCPDGTIIDCSGDGDCCPDSWIGDGFADCEDQAFGCDLTCYDNDGGDCDGGGTTTTTTTGAACDEVVWSTTMTYDWYCTGTPGSASMNLCANGTADLEGTPGTWYSEGGDLSLGDGLCPGEDIGLDLWFVFDNYTTKYMWDTEGDDIYTPGAGYHDDEGYNGADNADGLTCINGSEACNTGGGTTGGTTTGGECPAGTVDDCSGDGDCCPESWIGDGFEDCEDQAFGCDLTCYDNDGGDCGAGTTTTTSGGTTTGGDCPAGTVQDCVDDDCCPESWIGDGFEDCEDQAFGCDLTCYDNDGGDCGGGTTTTTTGGGNCDEVIWSTTMTYDWYCTGSPGSATMNLCANGVADLEGNSGTWVASGTEWPAADGLCPGETITNDLMFMFDNYTTKYVWDTEGDDIYTPGAGYHDDEGYNGPDNADGLTCINGSEACLGGGTTGGTTTTGGDCPAGTVQDCVDDDCCPESWIGDGFEDCEDQAFGCDLTCYDNDGGDCGDATGGTTGGTTTGGDCPAGTVQDCVDDDCCPESWIGDGFEDCEDQAYGCDLTCYDNDGGDCGGGTTTTTTTGGGDAYVTYTMTYDWYCTGSPGSASMFLYEDGTASLEGTPGTWMADGGEVALGDGLCPGDVFDNDLMFMFDNYTTVYMWDQADAGLCADGNGYHDDEGYNGQNIDGLTSLTYLSGECEDTDPCDGQAGGDANGDGAVNVLDVVGIVNYILAGGDGLDDCGAAVSDYNGDGAINVLDVVAIVNLILSGGGRTADATDATMIQTIDGVDITADGYIGGVQMTLSHGADFSIELTDNAYVAEYKTNGNSTMLIVINPENEEIFKSSGDFTVDEVLVTNSQEFIDVVKELPVSFTLSNAYPNPFNPTTTLTLDMTDQAFASVKVFNLRGEVVGVLMNDMVDAGSYTMTWDASNLSSGVYMIRAEASGQIATQKVMLVK